MSPARKKFPITISMLIITAQPHFLWCGRAEVLSQFQQKYTLFPIKIKVKCTLVQALRVSTGRTAHRGSRGIALPFLDHGTRRWWGVGITPRPLFTPGKEPVPIVQEAGWSPGPIWTDTENLARTGIRSPDRPARSQSLYRLSYPASFLKHWVKFLCVLLLVL